MKPVSLCPQTIEIYNTDTISAEHHAKILSKILAHQIKKMHQKHHSPRPRVIYSWCAGMVQHALIIKCNSSVTSWIISLDGEKTFNKIQHPFTIKKKIKQIVSKGKSSQYNQGNPWQTYSQHHIKWQRLESISSANWNHTKMSILNTVV